MPIIINSLILLFLFVILGWTADFAVKNIKYLGAVLKIPLFTFGVLLGLITTLPELSLGINTTIDKATSLSAGNLLGGIIVILGFVLGVTLILNKKIKTDGKLKSLIPTLLVIFTPTVLGIDGKYGLIDGLIMIGIYTGLIFFLYRFNDFGHHTHVEITSEDKISKAVIFAILGVIGILLASHWIVEITLNLLDYIQVSKLVVGLIVFAIGTNLPEISIVITSWRKKTSELSLSHLLSSAFSNVLILGVLALIRPITFNLSVAYWVTALFTALVLILFGFFYYSHKNLNRREGIILLTIYLSFLVTNVYLNWPTQ